MKTHTSLKSGRAENRGALSERNRFMHAAAHWNQCMPPRIKSHQSTPSVRGSSAEERRAWEEAVAGWWWL